MNFIAVKLSNNMTRKDLMVTSNTSVRKILEDNAIDYSRSGISLDTAPISGADLDKTLAQLGYDGTEGHNKAFLGVIVKADNA